MRVRPSHLARPSRFAFGLTLASFILQGAALLKLIPDGGGQGAPFAFGAAEMLLILLLAWNGWRIRMQLRADDRGAEIRRVAGLCAWSLTLCACGDLVNRNFFGQSFAYDGVTRFSYLADSVWFFLPGYALLIAAVWQAAKARVAARFMLATGAVAGLIGLLGYLGMRRPGTGAYVSLMTGAYAIPITVVACSALWLVRALGWRRAKRPAAGLVLATAADALIGNFWLFRDGYFPAVSHLNWMLYFMSQALVQQLPLCLARDTLPRPDSLPVGAVS